MKNVWNGPSHGSGLNKQAGKLKDQKIALKMWNNEVFGQVDQIIKELEA